MGQRLNIEIWTKGKALANAYFHWSAYSRDSLSLTSIILNYIQNNPLQKYTREFAIKCLESTGAGFNEDEKERIRKLKYYSDEEINKFQNCLSRNEGIIAITDEGINEIRSWQEGSISIYLDEQRIEYNVFSSQMGWIWEMEKRKENKDNDKYDYENLEIMPFNFTDIKYDHLDGFRKFIDNIIDNHDCCCFDPVQQRVITFIC